VNYYLRIIEKNSDNCELTSHSQFSTPPTPRSCAYFDSISKFAFRAWIALQNKCRARAKLGLQNEACLQLCVRMHLSVLFLQRRQLLFEQLLLTIKFGISHPNYDDWDGKSRCTHYGFFRGSHVWYHAVRYHQQHIVLGCVRARRCHSVYNQNLQDCFLLIRSALADEKLRSINNTRSCTFRKTVIFAVFRKCFVNSCTNDLLRLLIWIVHFIPSKLVIESITSGETSSAS